jgi:hypothetical protein
MATLAYATIEELLEAAFSVRSVPRLYNEEHLLCIDREGDKWVDSWWPVRQICQGERLVYIY